MDDNTEGISEVKLAGFQQYNHIQINTLTFLYPQCLSEQHQKKYLMCYKQHHNTVLIRAI